MKVKITIAFLCLNFICLGLFAQVPPLVYNAENTGAGFPSPALPTLNDLPVIDPLPDPFMWSDNSGRSTNFSDWSRRRNEIRAEIENYEIGRKPTRPANITATYTPGANPATGGTLVVVVTETNGQSLTLTSQVSLPVTGTAPYPIVIGMNSLNGSIPADIFTSRGIARITFNHNNVTTYGNPQNTNPFYRLYPDQNITNAGQYAAWSWGVSRLIDGLELTQATLPIDLNHIGVTGCSYAGKMALFAGAFDERIALTIAQESGGGGAPAWRVSEFGGDVEKLGATDHNWFKEDMFTFSGLNVPKLPHDHHELMAMVAPRALLVTGNTDFFWLSNPACYVSARAAHEVWKQFGIGDRFGFYIDGGHGHCAIPATQRPSIEQFVARFLKDSAAANTNVTVHPYPNVDYQRWYSWWGTNNPSFPDEASASKLWLEAECGTIGANWKVYQDPTASKGAYVMANLGLNSTGAAPRDIDSNKVVIPFTVDVAGTYNILGKCIGATATDDSYWARVDNGPWVSANGLAGTTWTWGRFTIAELQPGPHTLSIMYREDGAQLDKFLITTSNRSVISPELEGWNCGGPPAITGAQSFSVSETAANGSTVGNVAATDDAGTIYQKWTITGGTGATLFAIDPNTGGLTVADNSSFDYESANPKSYTLTLTVTDGYFTSAEETVTINITNANDNAPVITAGLTFAIDGGSCNELGTATGSDADNTNEPGYNTLQNWQIVGGNGQRIFAINAATGRISIADLGLADMGRNNFTIQVKVSDGTNTSAAQTITITVPNNIRMCHNGHVITVGKLAALAHALHGDCVGTCGSGPDYPALSVEASPNPTTNKFNIKIKRGNPTAPVTMRVYNTNGSILEQRQGLQVGQTFIIGQTYRAGLYLVEFSQGVDKEVLLLLKLR